MSTFDTLIQISYRNTQLSYKHTHRGYIWNQCKKSNALSCKWIWQIQFPCSDFYFPVRLRVHGCGAEPTDLWICGGVHVWFMLTYWDLIWARLQPPGSICSGSEVRMSWNRINRQQDEGQRWWSTGETVFVGWVGYITLIFIKKTVFLKTELCCHALCAVCWII